VRDRHFRAFALLLAALTLAVYGWRLWQGSLFVWDESLTAERSRELLVTGDWLTPHCLLEPDFRKPPLYYWLTAATSLLFGWDEITVRLWSALFAIGCVAVVALLAGRLSGDRWAGLLAGFLLISNPHWVNWTRIGLLDSGFLFGLLAGAALLLAQPRVPVHWAAAGACFALGSLIKNPFAILGLVIPLLHPESRERPGWIRALGATLAVYAALGLTWYGAQMLRWGGEYTRQFFVYNMVTRATTSIEGHGGGGGYYLRVWWNEAPLHVVLLVALLLWAVLCRRDLLRRHFCVLAPLLSVLVGLGVMASKRKLYLVYVHPFAAIVAGALLAAWLRQHRRLRPAVATALCATAVAFFVRSYIPVIDETRDIKEIARAIAPRARPGDLLLTHRMPPYAAMFYSGVLAREFPGWVPPDALDFTRGRPGGGLFLVADRKQLPRLVQEAVAKAAAPVATESIATSGALSAIRVSLAE